MGLCPLSFYINGKIMKTNLKKVEELILEVLEEFNIDLYHYELIEGGRNNFLRVFIDKDEGVSIDDCEKVSRELSVLLDVEDPIPYRYTLEVSSPGIERRLYNSNHFMKNVGKEIDVKLKKKNINLNSRRLVGILKNADDEGFSVGVNGNIFKIDYSDVELVKIKYRFK